MKYKAVIFDLDGVICSTDEYHYKAWKELAEHIGVHFNKEINNMLRGVSRKESLEIILQNHGIIYSDKEKKELTDKKNAIYRMLLEDMSPKDLDSDVEFVLKNLKERSVKIAIGSSSKNARLILGRLGIENEFDTISDGNNIRASKPDPEIFLRAAKSLDINPSDCLVVEDAKAGVLGAIAGGMDCAAIGYATKYGIAKYNLKSIKEIIEII